MIKKSWPQFLSQRLEMHLIGITRPNNRVSSFPWVAKYSPAPAATQDSFIKISKTWKSFLVLKLYYNLQTWALPTRRDTASTPCQSGCDWCPNFTCPELSTHFLSTTFSTRSRRAAARGLSSTGPSRASSSPRDLLGPALAQGRRTSTTVWCTTPPWSRSRRPALRPTTRPSCWSWWSDWSCWLATFGSGCVLSSDVAPTPAVSRPARWGKIFPVKQNLWDLLTLPSRTFPTIPSTRKNIPVRSCLAKILMISPGRDLLFRSQTIMKLKVFHLSLIAMSPRSDKIWNSCLVWKILNGEAAQFRV